MAMAKIEEPRADASDFRKWCPALAALLRRHRKNWLKAFRHCREEFSEASVHDIRVQSRRLMSVLSLVRAVHATDTVDLVEVRLKAFIKRFARLRDVQVQRGIISALARDHAEAAVLLAHLSQREQQLTQRLMGKLEQAGTRKLNQALRRLESRLKTMRDGFGARSLQTLQVLEAVGAAFQWVETLREQVDPRNTATIHRVRVAFKQFRYMVEALAAILPTNRRARLKAMQAYQTRMGEIQDMDVLLEHLVRFGIQQPEQKGSMKRLEGPVLERRGELIRRYLEQADELHTFWPLTGFPSLAADLKRMRQGEPAPPTRPAG